MTDNLETRENDAFSIDPPPLPDTKAVTRDFSLLLAAATIADKRFPDAALLPRVAAIPYNNLGHQPLVDYHLLSSVIWGTVNELRRKYLKSCRTTLILGGSVSTALLVSLAVAGGLALGVIAAVVAFMLTWKLAIRAFVKKAADTRASHVRLLLGGERPASARNAIPKNIELAAVGNGKLSDTRTAVFFANGDTDPFPGLGRLQARELFICPSKELTPPANHDATVLMNSLCDALRHVASQTPIDHMNSGWTVVVDPATIGKSSDWLDEESRPRLFVDNSSDREPLSLERLDGNASARAFFGLQVYVPDHLTQATLLVRSFLAGTSAAFELVVLTLGPPATTSRDLNWWLRLHTEKRETNDSVHKRAPASEDREPPWSRQNKRVHLDERLRQTQELRSKIEDPFAARTNYSDLADMKCFDEAVLSRELKEATRLEKSADEWVGRYTQQVNWRERHSLTIPRDFFGTTECRAIVRALFDQASRGVLAAVEELGYDISQYRDEGGRWTIQAQSIEQMVVGERITIADGKKETGESSTAQRDTKSGKADGDK